MMDPIGIGWMLVLTLGVVDFILGATTSHLPSTLLGATIIYFFVFLFLYGIWLEDQDKRGPRYDSLANSRSNALILTAKEV